MEEFEILSDRNQKLFEKAIGYINIRPRSQKEIREYLKKKEADDNAINQITDKLKYYNYINDADFAKYYIDSHRRRWGIVRIRAELKGYGVEGDIIDAAIQNTQSQADEVYILAERYMRQRANADYNKLYAYLYNKGFKSDDIKTAFIKLREEILQGED